VTEKRHSEKEACMLVRKKADRSWMPMAGAGIEFCGLRQNGTNGGAGLVRLKKGARFPTHNHPGWEEALIISGVVNIGGNRFEEETVFYVSSEQGIEILEDDQNS
jgi:quercetin dioxygenase-like cupin family protein